MVADRDDLAAVGQERRGHDAAAVLRELAQLFPGFQVPYADGTVLADFLFLAAGNRELAVRRDRHTKRGVRMALEAAKHLSGLRVPDAQVGVVAKGPLAVFGDRARPADDAAVTQAERRGPGDRGDFLEP